MASKKGNTRLAAVDKRALLRAVVDDLDAAIAVMVTAAKTAHEAATHAEMKPENDKDTRGLEAGYLAAGQSERAKELLQSKEALLSLTPRAFTDDDEVDVLALVTVVDADTDDESTLFVVPVPGGKKLPHAGRTITIVSPASPLGDAVVGRRVGDVVEVLLGPRRRELEIRAVR